MSARGIGSQEVPVSFASHYLTTSEGKGSAIIALASITSWTLHWCKCFLFFATQIEVIVPSADYMVTMPGMLNGKFPFPPSREAW